jgi:uncharacterized protein
MKTKLLKLSIPLLIVFFAPPVFAQERVIDNAGLLSPQEKTSLLGAIAAAASAYKFDLVIVTERNIGAYDPREYADDFFDNNDYSQGQNRDGCLFLLVTESRDYWFSTSGRGDKILNPAAFNKLESDVVKLLGEAGYYEAFRAFLLDWDEFLALDAKGRSYNFFHQWNLVLVSIAWVLALAIGFIVVGAWKKGMNTALPQSQAAAYAVPGSLAFGEKKDSFLYSTVTKTRMQKTAGSGASGGAYVSSSGRRHGGGKY